MKRLLILDFGGLGDAALLIPILKEIILHNEECEYYVTENAIYKTQFVQNYLGKAMPIGYVPQKWSFYGEKIWNEILDFIQLQEIDALMNLQPDVEYIGAFHNFFQWVINESQIKVFSIDYQDWELSHRNHLPLRRIIEDVCMKASLIDDAPDKYWLENACSDFKSAHHGNRVGFYTGSYMPPKRWPAEHWIKAGRYLLQTAGLQISIFGGTTKDELLLADLIFSELNSEFPNRVELFLRLSLDDVLTQMRLLDILLSNDTGVAHVLAGTKTPMIVLFWASDPRTWAPDSDFCAAFYDEDIPTVDSTVCLLTKMLEVRSSKESVIAFCTKYTSISRNKFSVSEGNRLGICYTNSTFDRRNNVIPIQSAKIRSSLALLEEMSIELMPLEGFKNKILTHPITDKVYNSFMKETKYVTLSEQRGYSWCLNKKNEYVMTACQQYENNTAPEEEPVVHVSWVDAYHFCAWLQTLLGNLKVSLPSLENNGLQGQHSAVDCSCERPLLEWMVNFPRFCTSSGDIAMRSLRYISCFNCYTRRQKVGKSLSSLRADRSASDITFRLELIMKDCHTSL